MDKKNDSFGKYKKSTDQSLKMTKIQKKEYIKFFKGICTIINDYNKKVGKQK